MSVDEELASPRVPIPTSFGRISQQGGREPVQSSTLCLEPLTTDVNDHSLTSAGRTHVIRLSDVGRRCRQAGLGRRCDADRGEHRDAEQGARRREVAGTWTDNRRRRR